MCTAESFATSNNLFAEDCEDRIDLSLEFKRFSSSVK